MFSLLTSDCHYNQFTSGLPRRRGDMLRQSLQYNKDRNMLLYTDWLRIALSVIIDRMYLADKMVSLFDS